MHTVCSMTQLSICWQEAYTMMYSNYYSKYVKRALFSIPLVVICCCFFFLNDVPPRTTSRIFFVRSYSNIFIYKIYVVNYRRCNQIYGWHKLQVWSFVWIVQDNQILNFVRMVTHTPHHNPNRIKIWTAIPFLPQKPKQNNKRVITIKMAGRGHRVITCKEFIGKYTT